MRNEFGIERLREIVEASLLKNGSIMPAAFVCHGEKIDPVDIGQGMVSDEAKDAMIPWLAGLLHSMAAHKLIIVSEVWLYMPPYDMSKEKVADLIRQGSFRDVLIRKEAYQLLEIMRDSSRCYTRLFDKQEDGTVKLGEVIGTSDDMSLDRFQPLSDALIRCA